MNSVMRFCVGDKEVDRTTIPTTTHGVPLVPRVGEIVHHDMLDFKVETVFWNYDEGLVIVSVVKLS